MKYIFQRPVALGYGVFLCLQLSTFKAYLYSSAFGLDPFY